MIEKIVHQERIDELKQTIEPGNILVHSLGENVSVTICCPECDAKVTMIWDEPMVRALYDLAPR